MTKPTAKEEVAEENAKFYCEKKDLSEIMPLFIH